MEGPELFVVKRGMDIIQGGFTDKPSAKKVRDKLNKEAGIVLDKDGRSTEIPFKVSYGQDHYKMKG
jgi:phage tail sheath gpL-like